MCDIGPGTILVCVEPIGELTKDAIYTCEDVHHEHFIDMLTDPCACGRDLDCLRVHIVGKNGCYCDTYLRPFIDGLPEIVEEEIKEPELV